ncbi:MAG: hypothetical protein HY231_24115 [Acidobacteria bacterium]|nr:hypothetical protein [Acidobacteriota bacterium]
MLSLSPAHVNKFGRVRESDEEPNGSGKRSDLERLIFTIKYFAAKYDLLHICQKLLFDIQQEIDEELARQAARAKPSNEAFEGIKERALQDISALTVAIGAGKSPEEISRLLANHLISTKRLIAVAKQQQK